MRTAAIFNPYWDTLGGGEKYVATVVKAYLSAGYEPYILWHDSDLTAKLRRRFDLDLTGAIVSPKLWRTFQTAGTTAKHKLSREFRSFFWVSDGSVPYIGSRINLLHFQVPFNKKASILNRIKIKNFDHILCNSRFTKNIIDKNYGCDSEILYPPVAPMPQNTKENIILSVGRFDNILHSKRQDILIETFKQLNLPGWKLILAGGSFDSTGKVDSLKKFIGDAQIEVVVNPSYAKIRQLYSVAKIYWHAAGFGSNLKKNPEKAEHFGIATVEAMSAGAVPLVFAGGGQLEIITEGENGYLWQTPEELVAKTLSVMENETNLGPLIDGAINTAAKFSQEQFIHEFHQFIS